MPYIGRSLSKNYSRIRGRGGVRTNAVRPEVKEWMSDLANKIAQNPECENFNGSPLEIDVSGKFWDWRGTPDLHNLHEVIADAVKSVEGIVDDKHISFRDGKILLGYSQPEIQLEIRPINGG